MGSAPMGGTPLFFCKSMIPGTLFRSLCKSIILWGLACSTFSGRYFHNVLIPIEFPRTPWFARDGDPGRIVIFSKRCDSIGFPFTVFTRV